MRRRLHSTPSWPLILMLVIGFSVPALAASFDPSNDLPGIDRPGVGRSIFDYVALSDDGKSFDIPFPFEKLVERVTARTGATPQLILIPKGRSLERDNANYDSPRIVLAIDQDGLQTEANLGLGARNKLYIGYAERGEQLEVISFNNALGRFEYQLVHDYSPTGKPRLVYANRTLCSKCHHNGAPMFSPAPWTETNGASIDDTRVADQISIALKGASSFHGVSVKVSRDIPYNIDKAILAANYLIPRQKLWMAGCGADDPEAAKCRGSVLKFALETLFTSPPSFSKSSEEYTQRLFPAWTKFWPQYLGGGLLVPSPQLLPYDPILDTTAQSGGFAELAKGLSDAEAKKLQQILRDSKIPPEKDPLFQFLAPIEEWTLNSVCFGDCLIYGIKAMFTATDRKLLLKAAGTDFKKVAVAVDALVGTNDPIFRDRAFRRGMVMRALLAQLGAPIPTGGADDDAPAMPAVSLDIPEIRPDDDSPLGLMLSYCTPCHANFSGKLGFLNDKYHPTDVDKMQAIRVQAKEIAIRLNWENPVPGKVLMPLENKTDPDSQRSRLTGRPDHRQAIINWVKSL